jgi:hypothetical protein
MYISTLVDDIEKALSVLESQTGKLSFAMLYSHSESADFGWNLIIAAPWIDRDTVAATGLIATTLNSVVGFENQTAIARITALETTDSFVRDAIFYSSRLGVPFPAPVRNLTFGGVPVVNGWILLSSGH